MLWSNILKIIHKAINFIHRYFQYCQDYTMEIRSSSSKKNIYWNNFIARNANSYCLLDLSEMIVKISIELSRSRYKDWQDIISKYLYKVPDNQRHLFGWNPKVSWIATCGISVLNLNIPRYNLISFFSKSLITSYIFVFLLLLLSSSFYFLL